MNRRGFLRFLGGGAALGAVAAVAPSQVWPFTKIFLPRGRIIVRPPLDQLAAQHYSAMESFAVNNWISEADIQAIELESFAKEIPSLFNRDNALYRRFKEHQEAVLLEAAGIRIPQQMRLANGSKIVFEPADGSGYRAKPDLAVSEVLSSLDRDIRGLLRS